MNYKMKKPKSTGNLKKNKWYIIMGCCLLLAGTFSWMGVNKALSDVEKSKLNLEENINQPVNEPSKDVPKPSQQENGSQQSASQSTTTEDSEKEPAKQTQSQEAQKSSYGWPVTGGKLGEGFSNGELKKSKTLGDWRTHNGIDILAKEGTEVKNVAEGKVTEVTDDPMWGTVVKVQTADKTICVYANLAKGAGVKKDQQLKQGDVIGKIGKTAAAEIGEDDHLHFEMLKDGSYISPMTKLKEEG